MSGSQGKYRTLVLSDIHLGEDLNPGASEEARKQADLSDRQLVEFFRYHTRIRENGRPWRIVFNGDCFDFLAMCVFPAEKQAHGGISGSSGSAESAESAESLENLNPENAAEEKGAEERDPDIASHGLHRSAVSAVAKVDLIAARHAELFRQMCRFVARNNCIDFVAGNHDMELQAPSVQQAIRKAMHDAWRGSKSRCPLNEEQLREGVRFHPWCLYEPGEYWIEHGHQYDENCSFLYGLSPWQSDSEDLVVNVDTAGCRYVTNMIRQADPHEQDEWTAGGYLRFGLSLGADGLAKTAAAYWRFYRACVRSFKTHARHPRLRRMRQRQHEQGLTRLAGVLKIELPTLRRIDMLRRRPAVASLHKVLRVLMLDKVFVFGGLAAVILIALVSAGSAWAAGVGAAGLPLSMLLMSVSGKGRTVDPQMDLRVVSERIAKTLGVKVVSFGHTHAPVREPIADGAHYVNSGTWIPAGKPGLRNAFTIVDIDSEGALLQWRSGARKDFKYTMTSEQGSASTADCSSLAALHDELERLGVADAKPTPLQDPG